MKKIRNAFVLLFALFVANIFVACSSGESAKPLTHYQINAVFDQENNTLSAEMSVDYINNTEFVLDEICLHLYPAAFRENARFSPVNEDMLSVAYPNGVDWGGIEISNLKLEEKDLPVTISGDDDNILVIPLDGELFPGDTVSFSLDFCLDIPNIRHRFGYTDTAVNLGNWYPVVCVVEEGKFITDPYYSVGDPFYSDCADYDVSVTLPGNLTVASSGEASVERGESADIYTLKGKSMRDFALVIGEFKLLGTSVNGVKVNYYYCSDDSAQATLDTAAQAIRTFSETFGAYPYKTYSVVKTQFLYGGMEYPALSMVSDALNPSLFTEAVIHETAHQWWYGVVGNDEVRYPWLDEGLAEFSTGVFYEKNPSYGVNAERRSADALGAYILYFEDGNRSSDMTRALFDYSDNFEYTYSTYVKGEVMFRALRSAVGDDSFFASLKSYYSRYKFSNARPDDLIACFEDTCQRDLEGFFSSWLEGKVKLFA